MNSLEIDRYTILYSPEAGIKRRITNKRDDIERFSCFEITEVTIVPNIYDASTMLFAATPLRHADLDNIRSKVVRRSDFLIEADR